MITEKQREEWLTKDSQVVYYDFQKNTILEAINKYINSKQRKLLVADEVGLGKTYIAQGVMKGLYEQWKEERQDEEVLKDFSVLYIAPNETVLTENVGKLLKDIDKKLIKWSDNPIDKMPRPIKQYEEIDEPENKINMMAGSPGILFSSKSPYGDKQERQIICKLLLECYKDEGVDKDFIYALSAMLFAPELYKKEEGHKVYNRTSDINDYLKWVQVIQSNQPLLHEDERISIKEKIEKNQKVFYELNVIKRCIKDIVEVYENMHGKSGSSFSEIIQECLKKRWILDEEELRNYEKQHQKDWADEHIEHLIYTYVCTIPFVVGRNVNKNSYLYEKEINYIFVELRNLFSEIMYMRQEPKLIIVDEFHRYFTEVEKKGIDRILKCSKDAKLLLLSATPYRINLEFDQEEYDGCKNQEAYSEKGKQGGCTFKGFVDVIEYLAEDKEVGEQTKELMNKMQEQLSNLNDVSCQISERGYREEGLITQWKEIFNHCKTMKECIEEKLKGYILRTERYMAYDMNSKEYISNPPKKGLITKEEAIVYKELKDIKKSLMYSKYTPYMLSFAKDYKQLCESEKPNQMLVRNFDERYLSHLFWNGETKYLTENLRLQELIKCALPEGIEKMLWIPPNMGVKKGVFKTFENYTKTLVFCNFVMSTRSISAILSQYIYEKVQFYKGCVKGIETFDIAYVKDAKGNTILDYISKVDTKLLNEAWREYFKRYEKNLLCAGVEQVEELYQYCKDGCLVEVLTEVYYLHKEKWEQKVCNALKFKGNKVKYFSQNAYRRAKDTGNTFMTLDATDNVECSFAMRLTNDLSDSGDTDSANSEKMKEAFNVPFYPFVMASTPVAQEGIDLHYYCHRIMHWNLPVSPVEFEQREGRITRFQSHLVRKHAIEPLKEEIGEVDMQWKDIFERIGTDKNGLIPNWHINIENSTAQIERICSYHKHSIEEERYEKLMQMIHIYRLSLGYGIDMDKIKDIINVADQLEYDIRKLFINLSASKW